MQTKSPRDDEHREPTTVKPEAKCIQCSNPADDRTDALCTPCAIELAYRIMNAEPEPTFLKCAACQSPYRYTEARVLRHAKNPRAKLSIETPSLCWVCTRLHYAAQVEN